MGKLSKAKKAQLERLGQGEAYSADEAFGLVKELANAKYRESVDVSVNLAVDPNKWFVDQRYFRTALASKFE